MLIFFFKIFIATLFCSIKVTFFAPLDSASKPKEPMPEYKSKILELIIKGLKKYPGRLTPTEILSYCGPYYITEIIEKNKHKLNNILILPSQYFYPWPNFLLDQNKNCYSFVSNNSYAIHHWKMSWHNWYIKIYARLYQLINKIL